MPPHKIKNRFERLTIALLCSAPALWFTPSQVQAQSTLEKGAEIAQTPAFGFHAQATYIWQLKPSFNAAYTGTNSLVPRREKSYSFTATADLGARLWKGAQVHFNPEGSQGVPLSNLTGAGSISNGELQRGSSDLGTVYRTQDLSRFIGYAGKHTPGEPKMCNAGDNSSGQSRQRQLTIHEPQQAC